MTITTLEFLGAPPRTGRFTRKEGFVPARPEQSTTASLNTVVNRATDELQLKGLPRDVTRWDKSHIAAELVACLPRSIRRRLPEEVERPPYTAHAAYAVLQMLTPPARSSRYENRLTPDLRMESPTLRRKLTAGAIDEFGEDEVEQCIEWLSAELQARNSTYGTRGIFLRGHFLGVCARVRRILDSHPQAPGHFSQITAMLIESQALVAAHYHRSGGIAYPSYSWSRT